MSTGNGGQSGTYPTGLSGPKCLSMVFCSDLKPMVNWAIKENGYLVESNFFGANATLNGGIDYVAAQFKISGEYRSHNAALRTLYRVMNEQAVCGASIGDALAIACETSLYTEDIREYPSRYKAALEIVFTEADEAGEILSPFDIQERATMLWRETYDRYVLEMEPFKERYEQARIARKEQRARRFRGLTGGVGALA
jgi:hypothetical protein